MGQNVSFKLTSCGRALTGGGSSTTSPCTHMPSISNERTASKRGTLSTTVQSYLFGCFVSWWSHSRQALNNSFRSYP